VQVYLDEADKPDIGEGLNKAAEVTLHKVFRMDKATNQPTTDPDAIARFERKLKKLAADQSARFISYKPDSGTWVFEVDHFSRCAHRPGPSSYLLLHERHAGLQSQL
jgi:nuclear pore complex protein Nup98-Nup96